MSGGIKVKATKLGLFGQIREPGDEFEISNEKQFSSRWMDKVPGKSKPKPKSESDGGSDLDALRERAGELGVKFQPNWGAGALTKHIAAAESGVDVQD